MVMDDAPIVTIFYRERFNLVKTTVKGLKPPHGRRDNRDTFFMKFPYLNKTACMY